MNERKVPLTESGRPPCLVYASFIKMSCNSIFWNLLQPLEISHAPMTGVMFVRELGRHTERCDHVHSLKHVRDAYRKEMTEECYNRVINNLNDARDDEVATSALFHYHSWTKTEIEKTLSWKSWIYCKTLYEPMIHLVALPPVLVLLSKEGRKRKPISACSSTTHGCAVYLP